MESIFEKLSKKYEINISYYNHRDNRHIYGLSEEEDAPCFLRVAELPGGFEEKDILPYLNACAGQTIGVVLLSTTEREEQHQLWLNAASEVKNCTITEGRSINHGGYKCWLIAITGTAKA